MKNTLIVNLYGGPGTGKSTGATYIFSRLKTAGVDAEYVSEFAKDKVWEGNREAFKCQFYLTGTQAYQISRCYGKVNVIVTDSPILLGKIYAERSGMPALGMACVEAASKYLNNSLDVMLHRVKKYNPNGRNESEEEAVGIDQEIVRMLDNHNIPYINASGDKNGYDCVFDIIMDKLKPILAQEAKTTARQVFRNRIYRHFKGKYYLVVDFAKHSETGETMVVYRHLGETMAVYRHLYGDGDLCTRPLSMFISEVDHNKYPDVKQTYRFELVDGIPTEEKKDG